MSISIIGGIGEAGGMNLLNGKKIRRMNVLDMLLFSGRFTFPFYISVFNS